MKLPLLTARKVAKILKKLEFNFVRQEGSHMFFRHKDGRTTVVPCHPNEKIDRGSFEQNSKERFENKQRGIYEECINSL